MNSIAISSESQVWNRSRPARFFVVPSLFSILSLFHSAPVCAQTAKHDAAQGSVSRDLAQFVATPAVSGYESGLVKILQSKLAALHPATDNLWRRYCHNRYRRASSFDCDSHGRTRFRRQRNHARWVPARSAPSSIRAAADFQFIVFRAARQSRHGKRQVDRRRRSRAFQAPSAWHDESAEVGRP